MNKELKFQNYWKTHTVISGYKLIGTEISLASPIKALGTNDSKNRRPIGRVDVTFSKNNSYFMGEIKYSSTTNDFWDATKILAYYHYYKWQNGDVSIVKKLKPCVIIPKNTLRIEHQIVAGLLGLIIFVIVEDGDKYKLEEASSYIAPF